jgi:sugar fermentation stimulation protein A
VTLVSLQTTLANRLTAKALAAGAIEELAGWEVKRAEYTYGRSRWDFYLEGLAQERLLLEVKSCTLVSEGIAMFPDAITERGKRHVQELTRLKLGGEFETAVLFVVQRADGERFRPAKQIDPAFSEALRTANDQGVKLIVYNSLVDLAGITWGRQLPVDFS